MKTKHAGLYLQDERWSGYVPWFLRHHDFNGQGDFEGFFELVAHRLKQFILYGEYGTGGNPMYFGDRLESESHQQFKFIPSGIGFDQQIQLFFSKTKIQKDITERYEAGPKYMEIEFTLRGIRSPGNKTAIKKGIPVIQNLHDVRAKKKSERAKSSLLRAYRREVILQRLAVLEAFLRVAPRFLPPPPQKGGYRFPGLRADLRRYLAASGVMLDIQEDPVLIVPIEEPLLQKEVIERLLPRLAQQFPQQEQDLIKAYHDLLNGVDTNSIFGNAFKALEHIAQGLSKNPNLQLNKPDEVRKHFPDLHGTTYTTITKLADHRGDKGAHGRQGPALHEIRYLLFTICNIALLLLEHPE